MTSLPDIKEQLRQSRSTFDVAFQVAAIGMVIADLVGNLVAVNIAFARI